MRPIQERLAGLAADLREDSRKAGIAAAEAKPHVEQAAADMTDSRKRVEVLEGQLAELWQAIADTEQAIADAKGAHQRTTDAHAEALAAVAVHDKEAQTAADTADDLDRLAAKVREERPTPPHEQHDATGLMREPAKVVEPGFRTPSGVALAAAVIDTGPVSATLYQDNGLPMVWSDACAPGGYVCAVYETAGGPGIDMPDGTRICGMPVESESCSEHGPADDSPFTAVPADPGTVARVTGALPVATPPVPHDPAGQIVATGPPDMTMPDLGPARPPLDPPPGDGTHTHAKPADGLMSRVTGGWPVVRRKKNDEQDGDQQ